MKTAVLALTTGGRQLAEKICLLLPDCTHDTRELKVFNKLTDLWPRVDGIICVMAAGIVVRSIGGLCRDKQQDPCVLVLDEQGRFVISLLSGHLGGGNELAQELAEKLGGQAVITTASDVTGHTALDLWAQKNGLLAESRKMLTAMSAKLVNQGRLRLYSEHDYDGLPWDLDMVTDPAEADLIVSDRLYPEVSGLYLRPRALTVGLGCNRGTPREAFVTALDELCRDAGLARNGIGGYASIDLKRDEQGLLDFASWENIELQFYHKDQLNAVAGVSSSDAVMAATGAKGVAEPAALLAAATIHGTGRLLVRKRKWKDVTAAVAVKQIRLKA